MEAKHDVLVVGAGCAGMRAAIEAFDAGADVAVVSKLHPTRSHSGAAEGGINAALGNAAEDNPEIHAYDTVKGSDYLGDQDAIEVFTREAPGHLPARELGLRLLAHRGRQARPAPVRRRRRAAHGVRGRHHRPRADPGALRADDAAATSTVYEEFFAWKLVVDDGRCQGVICWDLVNGGLKTIGAKTVVLATGGAGRLYRATTNAYACTGDGMAMALRAGRPAEGHGVHAVPPDDALPDAGS